MTHRILPGWMSGLGRVFPVVALIAVVGVIAQPAAAVQVTVDGVTYDVTELGFNRSFDDESIAIQATPWWGDSALADNIADAVASATGPRAYLRLFSDSTSGGNNSGFQIDANATSTPGYSTSNTNASVNITYMNGSIVAAPVPEIEAPALLQALFILFAWGVWLAQRRMRSGTEG